MLSYLAPPPASEKSEDLLASQKEERQGKREAGAIVAVSGEGKWDSNVKNSRPPPPPPLTGPCDALLVRKNEAKTTARLCYFVL